MTDLTRLEQETMQDVTEYARSLHAEGKDIVFTAAIIKDGKVIVQSRNEVGDTSDVSRHAEVVAIAQASEKLGTRDLSGATLLASCQPCEMCLATMRWAKIDRVIFAAQKKNIKTEFFRFPGLELQDFLNAAPEPLTAIGGVCEADVLHIYGRG